MANIILQKYRNIDIKILVRDYGFAVIDEIAGVVSNVDYSIDADSDVRRVANITMILKSDRSKNGVLNDVYFRSGNGYWFDKFVDIKVSIENSHTHEYNWYNIGTYLINEPTINYDASNNSVSFQAVDLMSKMTGMRSGYLSGLTTSIMTVDEAGYPTNATITGAMRSLLEEQGFDDVVIFEPPQNLVPSEIRIESGGTTYELLTQLRDINPNWEMFFDVNGKFYFKKIEDGQSIVDGNVVWDEHPSVMADDEIWDKLLISYSLSTSFENVKNYVEVYGHAYDSGGMKILEADESMLNVSTLNISYDGFIVNGVYTDFVIDIHGNITPIWDIRITDNNNRIFNIPCNPHITKGDKQYIVRIKDSAEDGLYIGEFQPCAIAWEDNPDSPFYVGEISNAEPLEYSSDKQYKFSDRVTYSGDIYKAKVTNPTASPPDATCWELDTSFMPFCNQWDSTVNYLEDAIVAYDGSLWLATQPSIGHPPVHFVSTYWYKLNSMVCDYNKLPTFNKMVRGVFAGGDFDSISTAQSAEEMARYQLYKACRLHDTITINCVPIYDIDVNRLISITLPNEDKASYWMVKNVNTDISENGTQTITAMRYYPEYPIWGKSYEYKEGGPFTPRKLLHPSKTLHPKKRV